jgi:hypothetical protein
MAGSQQQPELVAKPGLTLGGITGDGENGFVLSFGDTFKAPSRYTPDQDSEDLAARISALQAAVDNLKNFLEGVLKKNCLMKMKLTNY